MILGASIILELLWRLALRKSAELAPGRSKRSRQYEVGSVTNLWLESGCAGVTLLLTP